MRHKPSVGLNTLGIAKTQNGDTLCRVRFINNHFFHLETLDGKQISVYETDFMPSIQIPFRFRKHVFDSVAHIWASALTHYPDSIEADPGVMQSDSFTKKLRDSRTAKNKYGWQHPMVDDALWKLYADKIAITIHENKVFLGDHKINKVVMQVGTVKTLDIHVNLQNDNQIEAFCLLMHGRCFDRTAFIVTGLNPDKVNSLEERYDVGFIELPDGKYQTV